MAGIWRLFAVWLLLAGGADQGPPLADAVVTLKMTPDAAHAIVELGQSVESFAFADEAVIRDGDFEILTPGVTLEDDVVRGSEPFRRFELRITPTVTERDAAYPAHYRVGRGGVVYAPALRGDEASWRTSFRFEPEAGQIRLPSHGAAGDGFVFIGPAELRTEHADLVLIADEETPAWLVEQARTAQAAAIAYYARSTGVALPDKPLLIVKHWEAGQNIYTGDVTPGFVTTIRFRGPAWERPDASASKTIKSFLFHETFHLWNGALVSHLPGTPTWLHEGGAEYAALMAGADTGAHTDRDVRGKLSESLQRCRSGLQREGDLGLAQMGFLSHQVRYPCGMVIQWAADLHLRKTSMGTRNIMDVWAEMIGAARSRASNKYALADFYASARIAQPGAFAPASLLIEQAGPDRWTALPAALNALGAEVELAPPTLQAWQQALLFHLLRQTCDSGRFGFSIEEGTFALDTSDACGVLAGNPVLASVEGGTLLDLSAETYAKVQRKCAAKAAVTVMTAEGRALSVNCASPLSEPESDFVVRRWGR